LVSILFSCKKDGELSPDFDDGNLTIIFTDTFSLKTSIIEEPAGRTDVATLHLLGVYNDPIFGMKSSSIYTNVGLAGATTDLGDQITIDSIILTLDPVNYYGNSASSFTVNVFEISDNPLMPSTDYYSDTYTASQLTLLGSTVFTSSATDSILTAIDTVMHKHHLRVNLNDPTLITNIINGSPYTSNDALSAVFKGMHIVTSDTATYPAPIATGAGAISYFDMNSALSGVTIYYNNSIGDSHQENFILNSDIETYSYFINDFTSTDIEKHLANHLKDSRDTSRVYVSAMNGVRTKIEIPNIRELSKEGNIAINKAEISFTLVDGSDVSPDEILSSLSLTGVDESGNAIILADDPLFEGLDHYGGEYNTITKSFTFNITKHIYQLVTRTTPDYGMFLIANGSVTSANRIILNSENSPISAIKLEITYSKL